MNKCEAILSFPVRKYIKSYLTTKFNSADDHIFILDRRKDHSLSVLLHLISLSKRSYVNSYDINRVTINEDNYFVYRNEKLEETIHIHVSTRNETNVLCIDESSVYYFNKMMEIRIFDELKSFITGRMTSGQKFDLQNSCFEFLSSNGISEEEINYVSVLRKLHRHFKVYKKNTQKCHSLSAI